ETAAPHSIDIQVLYETLKSYAVKRDWPKCLGIDYREASKFQSMRWKTRRNAEFLVASPINIPDADLFISSLLQCYEQQDGTASRSLAEGNLTDNGAFQKLPSEILVKVLLYLDNASLKTCRLASRDVAIKSSTTWFWKSKIFVDMPWITALFPRGDTTEGNKVQWPIFYNTLKKIQRGHFTSDHQRGGNDENLSFVFTNYYLLSALGLQNRSRVWIICSEITKDYLDRTKKLYASLHSKAPILTGAETTPMSLLVVPECMKPDMGSISLVRDFSHISNAKPIITIYWTNSGDLAGIGTRHAEADTTQVIGSEDSFARSENVQLQNGDWLAAVVTVSRDGPIKRPGGDDSPRDRKVVGLKLLFLRTPPVQLGQTEGDLRILEPCQGHFVVGFNGSWSRDGSLEKLAILYQSIEKATEDSIYRLTPDTEASLPRGPMAMAYLWKNELPPTGLNIVPCLRSDHAWMFHGHGSPVESLVFGTCREDLANLVAIGVDSHFQGMEVIYADGSRRHIGPGRYAMQYYSVDGPGGESIISCYTALSGFDEVSLRFVTNRKRHLVFGNVDQEAIRIPAQQNHGDVLMGIYCHWYATYDDGIVTQQLSAIGGFTLYDKHFETEDIQTDSEGLYWNPSPPTRVHECGEVYGRTIHNADPPHWGTDPIHIPGENATVAWFDCGRPLTSIKISLCHTFYDRPQLPLAAISFTYADDGTTRSLGPTEFSVPEMKSKYGQPWCSCNLGTTEEDELRDRPHYIHDEWNVKGSCLKTLKVWLDSNKLLAAVQFISQDGSKSPIWGDHKKKKPIQLAIKSERPGFSPGLKLFCDANKLKNAAAEPIVVAVQLIEIEKSYDGTG
ncbi:hypothetical protein IL306_002648, partial [Fusarium sp. DS 682]